MKSHLFVVALIVMAAGLAWAGPQDEFCAGFAEGFKSVKGDAAMVPMCPMMPLVPMGSTPFREGIKAGIRAARA